MDISQRRKAADVLGICICMEASVGVRVWNSPGMLDAIADRVRHRIFVVAAVAQRKSHRSDAPDFTQTMIGFYSELGC